MAHSLFLTSLAIHQPHKSLAIHQPHKVDFQAARAAVERAERATQWHTLFEHFRPSCYFAKHEQTYGELMTKSMATVLHELPAVCALSAEQDAAFLDVGSGRGLFPLFVHVATGVRAVGVEVNRCRHEIAQHRQRAVRDVLPSNLSYVEADVRRVGLQNATTVYMHSTCFSPRLVQEVVQLVKQAGPRVRCILDSGRIDVQPALAEWGVPVHAVMTRLTWAPTAGTPLYYYVRKDLADAHRMHAIGAEVRKGFYADTLAGLEYQDREQWILGAG